ncbi:MAG TPA: alkaline phosphatase family protein [Bryobacteraceae bacterium]|nr:alkaline phosphatase family protein [Bryobacteraceae bacterium]
MITNNKKALSLVLLTSLAGMAVKAQNNPDWGSRQIRHVLLISVDGMHAADYLNCANGISSVNNGEPYCPALATLGQTGVNYLNTTTSKPSDSFPGLMALVTGGSPRTFGAFYDVAYDRSLAPPAKTTGNGVAAGPCVAGATPPGSRTEYDEGIDIDQTKLNGGAPGAGLFDGGIRSIDAARLVRDPANNCAPVFPWNFVRTNTIFGVIHAAGGYTAWSDKHPSYSAVSGPGNGTNVDDYFSPDINSSVVGLPGISTPNGMSCATVPDPSQTGAWTDSFQNIRCYDTIKVQAILHEINGRKHGGVQTAPVPNILGMNFQAVSVGQKLIEKNVGTGGYVDAMGTPTTELLREIEFVDASIGEMVTNLKDQGLYDSTLIVITAKHGQSPIDPHRFLPIPGPSGDNGESPANLIASLLPISESPLNPTGIGPTEDDISLLWLTDSHQTLNAVSVLEANAAKAGIGQIFYGATLDQMFNPPGLPPNGDPRSPDIAVAPNVGVVYTGSSAKLSEHGGFGHDDTNVIMLVSNPKISSRTVTSEVQTAQVAPTILKVLGLEPNSLDAVRQEGTPILPGTNFPWDEQ